jgi:hypothetical protein
MVLIVILSALSVLSAFIYLIVAHYVLAVEMSEDIKKTPPDVRLFPLDPKK